MALNASGAISLGGSTTGQSIAVELGLSTTAQISMNCTTVRTLAGIASGPIAFNSFYGKSNFPTTGIYYGGNNGGTLTNLVTRLNPCGALIGAETSAGITRRYHGGADMCGFAMYYAGQTGSNTGSNTNTATRINKCGALVSADTTPTNNSNPSLVGVGGTKLGVHGAFLFACSWQYRAVRLNSSGALVTNNITTVSGCPESQRHLAGAGSQVGNFGIFFGGLTANGCGCVFYNYSVKRLNICGTSVSVNTLAAPLNRAYAAGAKVGNNAMFYAGYSGCGVVGTVIRTNACGALVGTANTLGTARLALGGAGLGGNRGVFYAGATGSFLNRVTRFNACATLVAAETNVGTTRQGIAGAAA